VNVRRRGFTLIEILVVIGIILVLVGIVSVGITLVTKTGKNNAAKTTLQNLQSMIAELEAGAGLRGRQPAQMWTNPAIPASPQQYPATPSAAGPPPELNIWNDAEPQTPGGSPPYTNEPARIPYALTAKEFATSGTPERYNSVVILNTQLVMGLLLSDPDNKRALGQISAEHLMEQVPAGVTANLSPPPVSSPTPKKPAPPVPLDPWGNPIIFVPGAGLCGQNTTATDNDSMWVGGDPGATGAKKVVAVVTDPNTQVGPIVAPNGRPFWASAGPDGDFRKADDNLYSFEN